MLSVVSVLLSVKTVVYCVINQAFQVINVLQLALIYVHSYQINALLCLIRNHVFHYCYDWGCVLQQYK